VLGGLALARRAGDRAGRPLSRHDDEAERHQRFWDTVALAANLHTFTPSRLAALAAAAGFDRIRVRGCGLACIAWASAYYVLAGQLPGLAASRTARRRAGRTWERLRRLDAAVLERLLPDRALLTVQAVLR
jgi:hypothetical protein